MNCKISVIIPIYNVDKYLVRCLDSILNNTYKNIEVICVNDGSTDDSLEILKSYAENDKRVWVINKENGGLSSARNKGIEYVTGDFVAFVDSDDWIHKEYFSTLMHIQQKKDYDVVICDHIRTVEVGILDFQIDRFDELELTRDRYISNRKSKILVWGRVYKRSTIQDLCFDESMQIEDAMYNLEYIHHNPTVKAVYITAQLYAYYQREGSLVTRIDSFGMLEMAKKYFQYAKCEDDATVRNCMYIESIKKCLAARYGFKIYKNREKVKESSILANRGVKKLKENKFKYVIMVKYPFVYRLFRIINDPTMLNWEKMMKQ